MNSQNVFLKIHVLDDGTYEFYDKDDKKFDLLRPEEVGEKFKGQVIETAKVFPSFTYMKSNPRWVCVLGHWYYIP